MLGAPTEKATQRVAFFIVPACQAPSLGFSV
jgi:hypothetical protein